MTFNFGATSRRSGPRPMTERTPGRYGARPYTDREMWGAWAFLVCFGLPFAAGGTWALLNAPAKLAAHDLKGAVVLASVGAAFALVGFGLIAGSLWARRRVGADAAAAFAHPDEPWKWRADWAQGHVRARKHGGTRLDLASVPVPVGRTLAGTVRTQLAEVPWGGFKLTLSALRTERSGPDNDSQTSVVWEEKAYNAGQPSSDGTHVIVPIAIRIPDDAPSTDHSDASDELAWQLEVRAETPRLDYRATFDLPIYRTDDGPETASNAAHLHAVPRITAPPDAVR